MKQKMEYLRTKKEPCLKKYFLLVLVMVGIADVHSLPAFALKDKRACTFNLLVTGDTSICKGSSIVLLATGADSYSWSTGETTDRIIVRPDKSIDYWVMAAKGTCVDFTTVKVNVLPLPETKIEGASSICKGDSIVLTASGGTAYLWNTGSVLPSIKVAPHQRTTYRVIVSNQFCSDTAMVDVTVKPVMPLIIGHTATCVGEKELVYKVPSVRGISHYWWSVPDGWTIMSGQGSETLVVSPGIMPGNGQITVQGDHNECLTAIFPVVTSNCADHVFNLIKQLKQ